MISLTALKIDAEKSLGSKKILVDILPINEYRDNQKTDKILGHKYIIALPLLGYEKIGVRVPGEKMFEIQGEEPIFVEFDNLEVALFEFKGKIGFTAKATGVSVAKSQIIDEETRVPRAKKDVGPS